MATHGRIGQEMIDLAPYAKFDHFYIRESAEIRVGAHAEAILNLYPSYLKNRFTLPR